MPNPRRILLYRWWATRFRVATMREILRTYDPRFRFMWYYGFKYVEFAPWWYRILWVKKPRLANLLRALEIISWLVGRSRYGMSWVGRILSDLILMGLKKRYGSALSYYMREADIKRLRLLEEIYSEWLYKYFKKYAIPLYYVRVDRVTRRVVDYQILDLRLLREDPEVRLEVLKGITELILGKATLEEVAEKYPLAYGYLVWYVNSFYATGFRGTWFSLLISPYIINTMGRELEAFFVMYRIPACKIISDFMLWKSGRVDPHFQFIRYKPPEEVLEMLAVESNYYEEIGVMFDDLGRALLNSDYLTIFATPSMTKTFLAIGLGAPEIWTDIQVADPRAVARMTFTRFIRDYFMRRRSVYTVVRTMVYWMGFRA